jgi:CheY-like chemotaxis protein
MQRLEAIGYAVLEAANGEVGWKMIESGEPIDLVLSDVVMPGALSGYDLIRKVKAKYPLVATLLTSGHVSAALRDLDAADPKVRLLSKPYSLRDMAEAVAQALKQAREAN